MIGAALAFRHAGLKFQGVDLIDGEHGSLIAGCVVFTGDQGGAEGPHQPGDVRADDLHAHLLLKGPEDGLIIKGAPLDHHVPPQLLGAGGPDDLVDGVFHHGDGEARRDILHAGPVLLGLFDAGVHEDGAAASQVHRPVREEAQLGKVLHVVAQGLGEGLEKAAAAGGAGFIEEDVADGPVLDFEAFHILPADVDDKIHIGQEVPCGGEMGHGFHHAVVAVEGVFRQFLAVAGGGDGGHVKGRMLVVKLLEYAPNQRHGVAQVGPVVGEQQPGLLVDDRHFDGGGPGINADVDRGGVVRAEGGPVHPGPGVPGLEGLVLLLILKEGRLAAVGLPGAPVPEAVRHLPEVKALVGVERRPQGHE